MDIDRKNKKEIDAWPSYKKEEYNNSFATSKHSKKLDIAPLKRYIATWFDYIAQGECTIPILAISEYDAIGLAVKYMDAWHPHHTHTEEDISSLTCLDKYNNFYTREEIEEMYLKSHPKKEG